MTPADVGLRGGAGGRFGLALLQFLLVQSRLELLHRLCLILVLAALILALDDDIGRDMGDPHRAVGGVDVLPARARRTIGVDSQFTLVDLDLDVVVDLGINPYTGEAGVAPCRAVVRADPHQPMNPAFGLQIAIGVLALDQQRRRLDARLFARMMIDQLDLHAVTLAPAAVHPLQHPGPVLAFGPARASVDLDIAVVGVGLARQQRRDLVALGLVGEIAQCLHAVVDQPVVAFKLRHLDQFDRVLEVGFDLARRRDGFLQSATLAHHFLRRLGIVPQRRILDLVIKLRQPPVGLVPIEESAQQLGRGINLVDMSLRFGAHGNFFPLEAFRPPSKSRPAFARNQRCRRVPWVRPDAQQAGLRCGAESPDAARPHLLPPRWPAQRCAGSCDAARFRAGTLPK